MTARELVGRQVIASYASVGADGTRATRGRGTVIAYTDRPTVVIEDEDGARFSWVADLTEIDPDADRVTRLAQALVVAVEAAPHPHGVLWPEGSAIAFARRLLATGGVEVTL